MCLMLYLGSRRPLSLRRTACLALEPVAEAAKAVREQVQRDFVYFVGSHSGCSCGFPYVVAEQEIEYFDGVFEQEDSEKLKDLESVRDLVSVIDEALAGQPDCILFPIWNGSEGAAPKGDVRWDRKDMKAECFLLTEQFRFTICAERVAQSAGAHASRPESGRAMKGPSSVG